MDGRNIGCRHGTVAYPAADAQASKIHCEVIAGVLLRYGMEPAPDVCTTPKPRMTVATDASFPPQQEQFQSITRINSHGRGMLAFADVTLAYPSCQPRERKPKRESTSVESLVEPSTERFAAQHGSVPENQKEGNSAPKPFLCRKAPNVGKKDEEDGRKDPKQNRGQ